MRPSNGPARWFSIPPSRAIRKSSPILPIPARSSSSPIRKSATTARTKPTTKPPSRYIEGLVVREFSPLSSNWRADETAQAFLTNSGVPVISEIDTRRLVRHLRSRGVMRGVLWAGPTPQPDSQTSSRTRPQVSVHGRPRSRHARLHRKNLRLEARPNPLLALRTRRRRRRNPPSTSSPTISESSAISCAAWCMPAAESPWSPPEPPPKMCSP